MGTTKLNWIPTASAAAPWINGINAPPTIPWQTSPDPLLVMAPKPFTARVKIVGNIMELKKPTAKIDHMATSPELLMLTTIMMMAIIALPARYLVDAM